MEIKSNSCSVCMYHLKQVFFTNKHNMCVLSDTVRLLTRGLSTQKRCWAALADLSRQQEKCGCEGEQQQERERDRERERERAHWAFLYLSKDATLPSLHLLFWPPDPQGPARLELRQHFQRKCLNPNAQIYFSLSSDISFLTPFPHKIAYLPMNMEKSTQEAHANSLSPCVSSHRCGKGGLRCTVYLFMYRYVDSDTIVCCDILSLLLLLSLLWIQHLQLVDIEIKHCHALLYLVSPGE